MSEYADHEEIQENLEGSDSTEATTKAGKFKELASKRVPNVLEALRILGNLSNSNTYEYTPEQVAKIFTRIQSDLDEVKAKFEPKQKKAKDTSFEL